MPLTLNFAYKAEVYTGPGDRVDRHYVETFDIPIPEIDEAECVAVMRHKGFLGSLYTDRIPVDILLHEGSTFEPLMQSSYEGTEFKTVTRGVAAEAANLKALIHNVYGNHFPLAGVDKVKLKGPPRADRVIESARDRALKEMTRIAEGVVSIGGKIYVRVPEPVLIAGDKYVSLIKSADAVAFEERSNLFRLDQIEEAAARAKLIGGHSDMESIALPSYELFETDWLRHKPTPLDATVALRTFKSAVASRVDRLPIPSIIAYGRFRDGLRYVSSSYQPEDLEPATIEEVIDRARTLANCLPDGIIPNERAVMIDILDRISFDEAKDDDSLNLFIPDSAPPRY